MESGVLRLFAVAPLVAAPVVRVAVARVVIVVIDGDITHLCVLTRSIALIDGSGGRNGSALGPLINLGTQHDGRSARTWMKRV